MKKALFCIVTMLLALTVSARDYVGQTNKTSIFFTDKCHTENIDGITIERKYKVHFANQYSLPGFAVILDNNKLVQVRYSNYSYNDENKGKGLEVGVGTNGDSWGKFTVWKLGDALADQWVDEKIEIEEDGTLNYYQNGKLLKSGNFPELKLNSVKSFRLISSTYGWWTGHYHYMSNLKITAGETVINDDFSEFNTNLWKTPINPDGVRVDGGVMKLEQKRTDQDFTLNSKDISFNGDNTSLGGSDDGDIIVMEYRDYKFLDNEPDYKLYEDKVNIGVNGRCYCEATHKMYFLDGINTVIEYDLSNAMNKQVARRSFQLPFAVEMQGNVIEISPNGMYLAFVDEDGMALHIISTATGKEVASVPLGEKYKNLILKGEKTVSGHPFCFLSDNEILVSGTATAMLYDIANKKGKKLSFKKPYDQMPKYVVKSGGQISGFTTSPLQFVTFTVANGKMSAPIPGVFYEGTIGGMYGVYKNNSWKDWVLYDEKTGNRIDNQFQDSDKSKYVFKKNSTRRRYELQSMSVNQLSLYFPKMRWFEWLEDYKVLVIWTTDKKVQFFNHTLTDNEIEKQHLLAIMDKKSVQIFDDFIAENPNSRYLDVAKQQRIECIKANWQKLSSPLKYTATHAKAVKSYIDNYGTEVNVDAARAELENIYKQALNNIGRSDINGFNKYIRNFPESPYLSQAQKKLRDAYRYNYEELCQSVELQPYLDYPTNYPESPYLEDVRKRGQEIARRQQEEEQRIKEENERIREEEIRQRHAAKLNCVGRTIHWTETVKYDISSGDDGLIIGLIKNAVGLDKVEYEVRYSAVVESNIGETAVKCVITRVQIQDPSWASANYLKYKKYALSDLQENIGKTRVLQLDDFEL